MQAVCLVCIEGQAKLLLKCLLQVNRQVGQCGPVQEEFAQAKKVRIGILLRVILTAVGSTLNFGRGSTS